MRWSVQDRLVRKNANEWLNVHEDLRAAEHHEAEMAATDRLEGGAGAEVEWRERHCRLCGPNA